MLLYMMYYIILVLYVGASMTFLPGILKIKATYHPSKIITFRNFLLFRSIKEELKYDLHMAPRHFGDTCISSIRSRISIVSGTIIY